MLKKNLPLLGYPLTGEVDSFSANKSAIPKVKEWFLLSKIMLFITIILVHASTYGQVIKGMVFDDQTKTAIEFASVFINGSFTGTITDQDGQFELDISKNHSMPLTISAMGYHSLTVTGFSVHKPFLIYLSPQVYDIQELKISGKSYTRERKKYLRFFKNEFIGRSANARFCTITNEKDITFNYEDAKDTLKAFALKPLLIENAALGYRVTYYLDQFEYHSKKHVLFFSGNIIFNKDLSHDEYNREFYLNKREKTYSGSRMHFFRALWEGQSKKHIFQIRNSGGEGLKPVDYLTQESEHKYLTYPGSLEILHDNFYTRIHFLKDRVYFDRDGFFDPSGIRWEGAMALQRIADWLPYEYLHERPVQINH